MRDQTTTVDVFGQLVVGGPRDKKSGLMLWKTETLNTKYLSGIGTFYAQMGFPVSCCLDKCVEVGFVPCLTSAVYELQSAGQTKEAAVRTVKSALSDMIDEPPASWQTMVSMFKDEFDA